MATAIDISEVHRFSLEQYHQMIESGALEDMRVELIDGYIVEVTKGREHENALAWLLERVVRAIDWDRYELRAAAALTLEPAGSEPEPDLMVIPRDAPRPYHPATASLVVEVSVSSVRRDLVRKAALYAGAGVPEYWVVDLAGRRVIVHRDPRAGAYATATEVGAQGALRSEVLPGAELSVRELLDAAG